jgi:hypothetical protein
MTLSKKEQALVGITEATGVYPPGVDPMDESHSLEYLNALQAAVDTFNRRWIASLNQRIEETDRYLDNKR